MIISMFLVCFFDLHKKYYECKNPDIDYVNTLIVIEMPYLSEDCNKFMKSDKRFRDLFGKEIFEHWNFSEKFTEEQLRFIALKTLM
jgi:hypothetical protein